MSETRKNAALAGSLALATLLAAGSAQAAGGHHDVDDAAILASGECGQETWFSRGDNGRQRLHAGLNCGAGPVELGIAGEHGRGADSPGRTFWDVELKWAHEVAPGFAVGFDVQPVAQSNASPHYAGTSAYVIASWWPRADLAVHVNWGRDFVHGEADEARGGLALEWQPLAAWSFVAERYRTEATQFARIGARWAGGRNWNVDFSRAQRLAGPSPSTWTLGVAIAFGAN